MTASKKKPPKPARTSRTKAFFTKDSYSTMMHGLLDQGIDRDDAIETLKLGLREANGLPIPMELRNALPA